jgi:hypothetical protein
MQVDDDPLFAVGQQGMDNFLKKIRVFGTTD